MCTNASKQIYALLKPLMDAEGQGVDVAKLPDLAYEASLERFAQDFSNFPEHLSAVVRAALDDGEIELVQDADADAMRLRLTDKGKRSYHYVLNTEIAGVETPSRAKVSEGRAASETYRSDRLSMAMAG